MKIYTQTGDEGFTMRPDRQRVRKNHAAIEAVGSIDELNAHLGRCLAAVKDEQIRRALAPLPDELLCIGSLIAASGSDSKPNMGLDASAVERMEKQIDEATGKLPPLEHFILPGGCELACLLHIARTVCRRAERRVVAAPDAGLRLPDEALRYLNRLSDLLFVLARLANRLAGLDDEIWPTPK